MSALILAFGLTQPLLGPVADRLGRRPVLLTGLLRYTAASIGSVLAGSIGWLVAWRVLQGVAMAAAVVCARAIVRDLYEPIEGARVMSLALSGLGLIALARPLIGGVVAAPWGWRAALAVDRRVRRHLPGDRRAGGCPRRCAREPATRRTPARCCAQWARSRATPPSSPGRCSSPAPMAGCSPFSPARPSSSSTCWAARAGLRPVHRRLLAQLHRRHLLVPALAAAPRPGRHGKRGAAFTLAGGVSMVGAGLGRRDRSVGDRRAAVHLAFGHGIHQPCGQAAVVGPFPHACRRGLGAGRLHAGADRGGRRRRGWAWRWTARCCHCADDIGCMAVWPPRWWPGRWCSGTAQADERARHLPGRAHGLAARRPWRWPSTPRAARPVQPSRSSASIRRRSTAAWTSAPPSPARPSVPSAAPPDRHPRTRPGLFRGAVRRRCTAPDRRDRAARAPALLVGGTMLYFKALRDGLDAMPGADAESGASIDAAAAAQGWPALHAELARVDPAHGRAPGAGRCAAHPARARESGGSPEALVGLAPGRDTPAPPAGELPLVALEPESRAWLHARIAARFDAMLAAGLLHEVRRLRARGDLHAALPSMRCVGYRQAWQALDTGAGRAARNRHRRHAATGQAPAHLAALDDAAHAHRVRRAGRD